MDMFSQINCQITVIDLLQCRITCVIPHSYTFVYKMLRLQKVAHTSVAEQHYKGRSTSNRE